MTQVLQRHKDFFCKFFSIRHATLEEAVSFLCSSNGHHERPDQHIAIGLLLGYDWNSFVTFQKMNLPSNMDDASLPLDQECFEMGNTSDEEFSFKRIWPSNPFFCAKSPSYRAFEIPSDPQTSEIQEKILHLYNSDHFLEEFLSILVSEKYPEKG